MERTLQRLTAKLGVDVEYFYTNSTWTFLRTALNTLFGFLVVIAFTHLATKEAYGHYQFALAVIGVFGITALPGMNNSMLQSVARGYDGIYHYLVRVSVRWSILGSFGLLLVAAYYRFTGSFEPGVYVAAALLFPFAFGLNHWDTFLQARELFKQSALLRGLHGMLLAGAVISAILIKGPVYLPIIAYMLVQSIVNPLMTWVSFRYVRESKLDPESVNYGWFLTRIKILEVTTAYADKLLVGVFLGPAALAVYGLGAFVAKKVHEVVKSTLSVTYPKIARNYTVSMKRYALIGAASILMMIPLVLVLPYLFPLVFTDAYAESALIAQIILLFFPFVVIATLYKSHHFLHVRNARVIRSEAVSTPITKLLLMLILLPVLGPIGLAIVVGMEYVLTVLYLVFWTVFTG